MPWQKVHHPFLFLGGLRDAIFMKTLKALLQNILTHIFNESSVSGETWGFVFPHILFIVTRTQKTTGPFYLCQMFFSPALWLERTELWRHFFIVVQTLRAHHRAPSLARKPVWEGAMSKSRRWSLSGEECAPGICRSPVLEDGVGFKEDKLNVVDGCPRIHAAAKHVFGAALDDLEGSIVWWLCWSDCVLSHEDVCAITQRVRLM